jgi:carboxymethylenebutenolidase
MSGKEITIKAADGGEFMGYLAMPPSGNGHGIVVAQEIFGVNQVMRDLTDWLAGEGFVALCPDLFWRQKPGIQLTDKSEDEWNQAFGYMQGFDFDKGMSDIASSIAALRALDGCAGKVGAIGYCLGGRISMVAAARTDADAAVSYYGVYLHEHVGEPIKCPLMLHIAGEDEFFPKEGRDAVHQALDGNSNVTIHDYPGRNHAFARVGGQNYNEADAVAANSRSIDFLKANLA